ncbi:parathyroid hormone/parathyroid hormone-related peptide receptor-like [Ixodes scapularis]
MHEFSCEQNGSLCKVHLHLHTVKNCGDFCPRVWDGILCWESAPANTTARAPCPEYLDGFDTTRTASKLCTENGTWYLNPLHGQTWTNYSQCFLAKTSDSLSMFEASRRLHTKICYS